MLLFFRHHNIWGISARALQRGEQAAGHRLGISQRTYLFRGDDSRPTCLRGKLNGCISATVLQGIYITLNQHLGAMRDL